MRSSRRAPIAEIAQLRDRGRTTVVMTAFGPFPGVPVNATMLLVPKLAALARRAFPGVRFVVDVLPTEWATTPGRVGRLVATHVPDVILHFGVSSRARGFEIETRGVNVCAFAPDATGSLPGDAMIDASGPDVRTARLPVGEIVRRLRRRGITAYASRDAGTYLCNATLYGTLAMEARRPQGTRVGFVHVPAALVHPNRRTSTHRAATAPNAPLSWRDALAGGLEILSATLAVPIRLDPRAINRIL